MENKTNIAELLKYCPKGMKLYSPLVGECKFVKVHDYEARIIVESETGATVSFQTDGRYYDYPNAECLLYPSKDKTTWEGFVPPCQFKVGDWITNGDCTWKVISVDYLDYTLQNQLGECVDDTIDYVNKAFHLWTINDAKNGDVLAFNDETIVIFKDLYNKTSFHSYCHIEEGIFTISKKDMPDWWEGRGFYPATEEQRDFLFQKIKEAGYKWNPETKTLEKLIEPKFKVGDIIKSAYNEDCRYVITHVTDTHYTLEEVEDKFKYTEPIIDDKHWELVPDKFDIAILKPFESRVLVRDMDTHNWIGAFYSHYKPNGKKFYIMGGSYYFQCIPYEGNEHLLDTTDDCNEYFKTW